MINILNVLFPYIVLFYVLDCFVLVKNFQLIFYSHFGGAYTLRTKGLRFIGLSPFCRFFSASNFPFFTTEKGIFLWNKQRLDKYELYDPDGFDFVAFDKIKTIDCDGETLMIKELKNPVPKKLYSGSLLNTHALAGKLAALKKQTPEERKKTHTGLLNGSDNPTQVLTRHRVLFSMIRFLGALLFVHIFIFLPCFLYLTFFPGLNVILINMLLLYGLTIGLSFYVSKKTRLPLKRAYLFLFSLVFSPVSAIHATQVLTKHLVLTQDWVCLCACILPVKKFKKILVRELKRIHFSRIKNDDENLSLFLQLKEKQYLSLLGTAGLKLGDVLAPPERKDAFASYYCPFCGTDYLKNVGKCLDCHIDLVKYDGLQG